MLLTCAEGRWLKSTSEGSGDCGWLKTSKSSSESETSTTFAIASGIGWKEVASSSVMRWNGNSTCYVSSGGVPARKPGTAILICCNRWSFAFITYLGAWKLEEIGL